MKRISNTKITMNKMTAHLNIIEDTRRRKDLMAETTNHLTVMIEEHN